MNNEQIRKMMARYAEAMSATVDTHTEDSDVLEGDMYSTVDAKGSCTSGFDALAWQIARYEGLAMMRVDPEGYVDDLADAGFSRQRVLAVRQPRAGMAATYHCGSDRYPCTVARVISEKEITVRRDRLMPDIDDDPNAPEVVLTLRRDGRWREKGDTEKGFIYTLGSRRFYSDPSF